MTPEQREALGPYVAAAWQYCEDVLEGRVVAGELLRMACRRQLEDLARDPESWLYYFDAEEANARCARIEELPHIEGEWAARGETIRLEPWQCFIVTCLFGWKRIDDGARRFRTGYAEVARKNAKTTLAAAIGILLLEGDGEAGAQVYSAATKKEQAALVFNLAREMVRRCQARGLPWAKRLTVHKRRIFIDQTASFFLPLDAQGKRQDGFNVHGCINDELHAWEKRNLYDVLETGMGARRQPMILNITTAGDNLAGIGYELRGYGVRLLERALEDETFWVCIWTIDKDDNPWDPAVWPKANPNFGVSVYPLDMERLARKAQQLPGQQHGFLTKRLNVWVNASQAWMDLRKWNERGDPEISLERLRDWPCWIGVDLASKRDLAAVAVVFRVEQGGEVHWYVLLRHYLPEYAVKNSANAGHYDGWARAGHLVVTPGNILDVDRIEADVEALAATHQVQEVAYDPGHNSTQFGLHIAEKGITAVEVRPTVLNFSDPMKWVEAYVLNGTLHHAADPVLTWGISNVCVKRDQKDNIFPRKEHEDRKIDGPVATFMAFNRALAAETNRDPYATRGVVTV